MGYVPFEARGAAKGRIGNPVGNAILGGGLAGLSSVGNFGRRKRELRDTAAMMKYQHELGMERDINKVGAEAAHTQIKGKDTRKTITHKTKNDIKLSDAKTNHAIELDNAKHGNARETLVANNAANVATLRDLHDNFPSLTGATTSATGVKGSFDRKTPTTPPPGGGAGGGAGAGMPHPQQRGSQFSDTAQPIYSNTSAAPVPQPVFKQA